MSDASGRAAGELVPQGRQPWVRGARINAITSPAVLPAVVRQFSLLMPHPAPDGAPLFPHIELAGDLQAAVPRRQQQFRAGRYCANEALRQLDPGLCGAAVGRTEGGAPVWPRGVTGSVTHTDGFVSAAVAWTYDARGLGLDCERVMCARRAAAVSHLIAGSSELALAGRSVMDGMQAATLVFSAKESVFKCLHPIVGRMFGFGDVQLVDVDSTTRTFECRILRDFAFQLTAGTTVRGQFEIDDPWIHTGLLLTPAAGSTRSTATEIRRTSTGESLRSGTGVFAAGCDTVC